MKKWINQILRRGASEPRIERKEPVEATQPAVKNTHAYSSDQPISSRNEDRFNRWAFAERVADTMAGRSDAASIVIGLYGPWGDGKTSTLRLMEVALQNYVHVVVVRFNPWHFQSEEYLLKGFFATLAQVLGKSLPTMKEKIGKIFKDYGSLLSLASISIGGVVQLSPGEAAKGLGEALSTVELDELRSRIESILAESGKRVVVLIDDIDRLDRAETQAIFKLVKLSASFNHTSYVLAFDDEIVAAAIGEKYGHGGLEAGRAFLEKIIQVPLHLPPPDEIALRQMTFEGVDAALTQSGNSLSQENVDAFVRYFVDGLEPQLHTPRHAKLYANALTFALPLLKGEAHPVNLMLIEGIRIFYPKLYIAIRDNPEYFLNTGGDRHEHEAHRQRAAAIIDEALEGIGVLDKEQVRARLLEVLFPRLSNMGYGPDWDKRWEREQRVCSDKYFKRYYTYSVPPGDVSDIEVERHLEAVATMSPADADEALKAFAARNAMPQLIRKLRNRENEIDAAAARSLALAIARNGMLVPRERAMLMSDWTFRQAAILVAHLLRRVTAGEARETLADMVIKEEAQPLPFGMECLRWIHHDEKEPDEKRIISSAVEGMISAALAERVRAEAVKSPLYRTFGRDAPWLYWFWNKQVGGDAVAAHLRARFEEHPDEVDSFLDTFVGEAWGMESGLPHRADFDRGNYDAVARLIDPSFLLISLKQRYGTELDAREYYHGSETPLARRIAHQFAYIHLKVVEEKTQPVAAPGDQ